MRIPYRARTAVLDCIDRGDGKDGAYHVAAMCILYAPGVFELGTLTVIRAGTLYRHTTTVTATIDATTQQFDYRDSVRFTDREEIRTHWALRGDYETQKFLLDRAAEGAGDLAFSITHDGTTRNGTASLRPRDADAAEEYMTRCTALHAESVR